MRWVWMLRPSRWSRIPGNPDNQVFGSGSIETHFDHRIAMSFLIAGLRGSGRSKVLGVACRDQLEFPRAVFVLSQY